MIELEVTEIGHVSRLRCGHAAMTLTPPGLDVLTVEAKINLLAPAQGETFLAVGAVLRRGRLLTVCRSDVLATSGDHHRPRARDRDSRACARLKARVIGYPPRVQVRWVIAGTFAVIGASAVLAGALFALELDPRWWPYAMYALAPLAGGALVVAHAPLRPWREPAIAAVLAVAITVVLAFARPDMELNWLLSRVLQPWYAGLGIAVGSCVMAVAGGLAVRRLATARPGTARIAILSALVITGGTGIASLATYDTPAWMIVGLAGILGGGFITQAAIEPRRPWACASGGLLSALLTLAFQQDLSASRIGSSIIGGLLCVLLASWGARLAWRILGREDAPSPDVPPARLG